MKLVDSRFFTEALTERDEDDTLELPEAWALADFDDLLYWAHRPTASPLGYEALADSS